MNWIGENLGTIIVATIVFSFLIFLIVRMIIKNKKGENSCSCGCSACPSSQYCKSKEKQEKKD